MNWVIIGSGNACTKLHLLTDPLPMCCHLLDPCQQMINICEIVHVWTRYSFRLSLVMFCLNIFRWYINVSFLFSSPVTTRKWRKPTSWRWRCLCSPRWHVLSSLVTWCHNHPIRCQETPLLTLPGKFTLTWTITTYPVIFFDQCHKVLDYLWSPP